MCKNTKNGENDNWEVSLTSGFCLSLLALKFVAYRPYRLQPETEIEVNTQKNIIFHLHKIGRNLMQRKLLRKKTIIKKS